MLVSTGMNLLQPVQRLLGINLLQPVIGGNITCDMLISIQACALVVNVHNEAFVCLTFGWRVQLFSLLNKIGYWLVFGCPEPGFIAV